MGTGGVRMSWRGGPDDEKVCAKAGEEFIAATTPTAWSVLEGSMVAVACGRPSIERHSAPARQTASCADL